MKIKWFFSIKLIGILLTALLLSSCEDVTNKPMVNNPFTEVEFKLPKGNEYQIKLNGLEIDAKKLKGYTTPNEPVSIEISLDGKEVFNKTDLAIPDNKIFSFYEVLGHGLMNITQPAEELHTLKVVVPAPTEGVTILVKGIADKPNGIAIDNDTECQLSAADVATGKVSVEILKENDLVWDRTISAEENSSQFALTWTPDQKLIMLEKPTDEMKAKIQKKYDVWVTFMFSSEHYPGHSSLVVEVAEPKDLIVDPMEGIPTGLKEGATPVSFTLKEGKPSKFEFFADVPENHSMDWWYITIVKIYDPADPDNPIYSIDNVIDDLANKGALPPLFYGFGEVPEKPEYRFRCYKLIPMEHPDSPYDPEDWGEVPVVHYSVFEEGFSYTLD